jgi:thioredoxin reductase (NADPH)
VQQTDVTIVGAGPAGISSAIYLHRAGWAPLLIERAEPGGLLRNANLVENYPGFPGGIKGPELVALFKKQLEALNIRVTASDVKKVSVVRGAFRIETKAQSYASRCVILATGTRPKRIEFKGGAGLVGTRLFSEIVEMPLTSIAGKRIVVVGGGDAAFDYSLNLVDRGADVTAISRSEPTCLPLLRARAETSGVQLVVGAAVDKMRLKDGEILVGFGSGKQRVEFPADYVLSACGREPNLDCLSKSLRTRIRKGARVPETDIPGLYAVGDVVRGKHRQTAIAVGDGIHAGMMADEYLRESEGRR